MPKQHGPDHHLHVNTIGQVAKRGAWHIGTSDAPLCGREWLTAELIAPGVNPYRALKAHQPACVQCRENYAAYRQAANPDR